MPPSLDPKYVPKQWRSVYTLALFSAVLLGAAGTALAVVHVEAGRVVDAKWDDKFRSEVKSIATESATLAARDAVTQVAREEISPLRERLGRLEERVESTKATVAACCPVAPRGAYSSSPAATGGP